jgi:zinc transporter 9
MGLYRLVVLSSLMLLSTLLASFAPLYLDLSPRKVKLVSTYSTGLLVGAALSIVIPEGVSAVFESTEGGGTSETNHRHDEGSSGWIGASLLAGFILM